MSVITVDTVVPGELAGALCDLAAHLDEQVWCLLRGEGDPLARIEEVITELRVLANTN